MFNFSPKFQQAIINQFNKAASSYEEFSELQKIVGKKLIDYLAQELIVSNYQIIADVGCGSGFLTHLFIERFRACDVRPEQVLAVDIACNMLQQASLKGYGAAAINFICADAARLPISDSFLNVVFSNLMLQWCQNLFLALSELKRVLRKNGVLVFSTLTQGTLRELKQAGAAVNDFIATEDVVDLLKKCEFSEINIFTEAVVLQYNSVIDLMRQLKGIGANAVKRGVLQEEKINTVSQLTRVCENYQAYRNPQGLLPATFQVLYGIIKK